MKIHDFARKGDVDGVSIEIAAGVDVDSLEVCSQHSSLQCVCALPNASLAMVQFLIQAGANLTPDVFCATVQTGSLETIRYLLNVGASVACQKGECDILAMAAYGRTRWSDPTLMAVLQLLIENGASVHNISDYGESALRIASHKGQFDVVRYLLERGAPPEQLEWTELLYAVALGAVEDVASCLEQGASLQDRDWWDRTPWLLSLQTGDREKARLLLAAGADRAERGHCEQPPIIYALESEQNQVVEWLIEEGFNVNDSNEFGTTPLMAAAAQGDADAVRLLLQAGAAPNRVDHIGHLAIQAASSLEVALLLTAGGDLSLINDELRREIIGTLADDVPATQEQFQQGKSRQFGHSNPTRRDNPFWNAMVRCGCSADQARLMFGATERADEPVWCYDRFGRTTTLLPDGRIIEIGGEHEDFYDPDFCIYNDVVVFDGKGNFEIFSYPANVFPPTDFHSATLVGEYIYIIGSLGYMADRKSGYTPVFRLHCSSLKIEPVQTTGEKPGWVSGHKASYEPETNCICISDGQVQSSAKELSKNTMRYTLNLTSSLWARE